MNNIISTADSAVNVIAWVFACTVGLVGLGFALAPFVSLPARVESNEESIRSINARLDGSDKKLDVLICFHTSAIDGRDPAACSLR